MGEAHGQRHSCGAGGGGHLDGGGKRLGGRFFDDDVVSGAGSLHRERRMKIVRHRQKNGVHVIPGEDILGGRDRVDAVTQREFCGERRQWIEAGDELGVGRLGNGRRVLLADVSAAEQRDPEHSGCSGERIVDEFAGNAAAQLERLVPKADTPRRKIRKM